MDIKPADGSRVHFRKVLTSTITKLVGEGTRQAVVFVNKKDVYNMKFLKDFE